MKREEKFVQYVHHMTDVGWLYVCLSCNNYSNM